MNRLTIRAVRAALLLTLLIPATAGAQAHLQLIGGTTRAAETNPFFGAAVGVRLGALELDLEGGRFTDILAKGVLDALNELQRQKGLPLQGIASVPATYALASLRVIPGIGPVRPFVSGGFGVARMTPRFDVVVEGISLGDIFGLTSFEAQTRPMAAAGAGLRIDAGRVHVEGGYRYLVVFSDFETLNFSTNSVVTHINNIYAALGVRF